MQNYFNNESYTGIGEKMNKIDEYFKKALITKKGKVFFSELRCYEQLEITLNEYFHGVDYDKKVRNILVHYFSLYASRYSLLQSKS